jgi:hypothetical protein
MRMRPPIVIRLRKRKQISTSAGMRISIGI